MVTHKIPHESAAEFRRPIKRRSTWVFRKSVTGVFGDVTDGFGNVTGQFGDVTDGPSSVF